MLFLKTPKLLFLVLIAISTPCLAQKKISADDMPATKPKDCKDPESCKGNAIAGAGREKSIMSAEELAVHNKRASEFLQSNDEFFAKKQNAKLKSAARATVQILPKCAIGIKGDGYSIVGEKPEFCKGHPLSRWGLPNMPENLPTMAGARGERDACAAKPCSGALVGDQQTITTAAHCVEASSPEEFCKNFVFVFNRTDNKTDFTKDEVAECESGEMVNTNKDIRDFNMNADYKTKDHAGFKLKKPVPDTVATALKMRTTELNSQEEVYASGHPKGSSRMISTLKTPKKVDPSATNYGYVHAEGYVYQGNSGGPLLDKNGEVVGILSAVDDKRHGNKDEREPTVIDKENGQRCRTTVAPGPITVEAITYGKEIRDMTKRVGGREANSEAVAPSNSNIQ